MTAPLIGLIGYKRSGKNTVADLLGAQWSQVAFADPLRDAAYALNPIVYPYFDSDDGTAIIRYREVIDELGYEGAKTDYPEVRAILQRLGTDAIRALDDDFWLRAGMTRVDDQRTRGPVVVTDARFPNEADAIRKRGGYIVRVNRPGTIPGPDAHESETALDDYDSDLDIENDGDLDYLAEQVRHTAAVVLAAHELRSSMHHVIS